jgi:hypothetical protein
VFPACKLSVLAVGRSSEFESCILTRRRERVLLFGGSRLKLTFISSSQQPTWSMVLCEWFSRIPFDPDILHSESRKYSPQRPVYDLGSGARLETGRCPFCRLVNRAFSEGHSDLNKYLHMKARWTSGPGGRPAFSILDTAPDIFIRFRRTAAHKTVRIAGSS